MIISKIYRFLHRKIETLTFVFKISHLKLKYPSLQFKKGTNSYIGKNCHIVCVDGGKMILDNVHIADGVFLFCQKGAELILKNCFIGRYSVIVAVKGVIINENCEIAEMVVIRDQNHNHDLSDTPISEQGLNTEKITIESNVWIGAKATILKGVTIGKNSIVGANAVVTKSFPEKSLILGVPAHNIK